MFESLCQITHETLVSGKCPWCGHVIVEGRDTVADLVGNVVLNQFAKLDTKEAIPILHAFLKTGNAALRMFAAVHLGEIGSDAKELLPDLNLLLEDEDEKVRAAAKEAIRKINEASGGKQP